jgi:hypothetical protein
LLLFLCCCEGGEHSGSSRAATNGPLFVLTAPFIFADHFGASGKQKRQHSVVRRQLLGQRLDQLGVDLLQALYAIAGADNEGGVGVLGE